MVRLEFPTSSPILSLVTLNRSVASLSCLWRVLTLALAEYSTITNNDCNVKCPHVNLSLCITEADPLRSPFCNVPAEITSKTVVYPEDNIFYSKFAFINLGYGIVYIQPCCYVLRASLLAAFLNADWTRRSAGTRDMVINFHIWKSYTSITARILS